MRTTTELTLHDVEDLALAGEDVTSRWIRLTMATATCELTMYFVLSREGIVAWQQLRQGLALASDYVLIIDRKVIKPRERDRAITEWLFARQAAQTKGVA